MFGLNVFVEPDGTGQINAKKQDDYNIHFRKPDANLMITEKHTDNYFRQEGDIPSQMNLNNLQNYNPTSAGVSYFKEHETNKHIHHGGYHSHPANETKPDHKDTKIVDKIEKWRKPNIGFEKPREHSHRLEVVKV